MTVAHEAIWSPYESAAIAIATLDVKSLVSEHQIALTVGDQLQIQEVTVTKGWYRGANLSTGSSGIFPASYVLIKKSEENLDVVTNELVIVMREWSSILKNYYREKRMQDYKVMKERLFELMKWHTQLFSPKTTAETREPLKKKVIDKIQEGRLLMGLDMVVRTATGEIADETNTGIIPLYRMHQELANTTTDQQHHGQPQSLTPGAPRKQQADTLCHLYLDFKIFMCSVGEITELYFSLFNRTENRFISDEYQIVLTAHGMPTDIDKIGKLSTIFTDLSKKELPSLYLVCRLVRKGRMLVTDGAKKEKLGNPVRRPFGCAVLPLEGNVTELTLGAKQKLTEHTVPIYATSQESLFPTLHELIIKGQSNLYQEAPKAKGVCIGLALYTGEYQQIAKDPALTTVWPTSKLGMPDIILPGFSRNDLFVMVEGGEYSKERKTAQKNVEVIMQLVLDTGEVLKDAIFTGSEKPKMEQRSVVHYHSNQPHWSETVRVVLPLAKLSQAYLVFYSRHVSTGEGKEKPPNSVSYLKLTNIDGTIIADKTHNIPSYKPGKSLDEPIPNLKDPAMAKLLRQGEVLRVRTVLCSTMCTQNIALLSLLKWESYAGDLGELMNRFTFVDQGEIIKFIQEIFDAMFAILDANKIPNHEAVYHAIVFTISLLVDERTSYTSFRPVLDVYIKNHLKSIRAHSHLITCLKTTFDKLNTQQSSKAVMPTLKSLEYIIKFIIVSWLNYLKTNPQDQVIHQTNFKFELQGVLSSFNVLMQRSEREFIGAQTVALKNFMSIFMDIEKIFNISERSKIAIDFIDSVKYDENRKLLNLEKLVLITGLVESDLFLRDEVRGIMLPTVVRNLKQHLGGAAADDVLKCGKILHHIMGSLQVRLKDPTASVPLISSQVELLATVLPETMACIKSLGRNSRARLDLIHCMFSIFYLMDRGHFESFLKDEAGVPRKQYLLATFDLLESLLSSGTAYPDNWFTLMLLQYTVIRKVILEMSRHVLDRAKSVGSSAPAKPKISTNLAKLNTAALELQTWSNTPIGQEYDIWVSYLKLCIVFLKAKSLALENFSEIKQRTILKSRNGDLRDDVIQSLKTLWDALGPHQIHMLDDAVGPFLELVIINQPTIRSTGLSLYTSLLRSEYENSGALVAMEKATINTLDRLLNDSGAEPAIVETYRTFYTQILPEKFTGDSPVAVRAQKFLKDTSTFLELLYELRTLPNTIEYEDDRTVATMKLMAYLKQAERRDTYVKYVHKLSKQHLSSNNYIEAGLTLLLHADLLEWNDELVDELPDIGYPSETQRERKERLFKLSIEYLDKGKAWEKAITLLAQLRNLYEFTLFDYPKLADILQTESQFYRKIVGVDRFFAEYFRVGYYGKGFEPSIQNKEFIYRGFELERMADFAQRVQAKFPNAGQLTYTHAPPPEIVGGNGQWLQIFAVKPYSEELEESKNGTPFPPAIAKYRQSNNVHVFLYSKPFRKVKTDNEFADLWLMNAYYYTEDTFPTTHRRSEIIKKTITELPPIDNAYNAIKNKNIEIIEMTQKYERGTEQNINPYTMVLKGVIDAAVNGGADKYRSAFFVPEYIAENPDHAARVTGLKQVLEDQLGVLESALNVYNKICPPEMLGLLDQLEDLFSKMKEKMGGEKRARPIPTAMAGKEGGGAGKEGGASSPGTPVTSRHGHHHNHSHSSVSNPGSAPGTPVNSRRHKDD